MAEVLSNLAKTFKDGRNSPDMVASLASKTTAFGTLPNVSHVDLIERNLFGHHIEMSCRPIVGNAKPMRNDEGKAGWLIDETPEEKALAKWRQGDCSEAERIRAEGWRTFASSLNPQLFIDAVDELSPPPDQVKRFELADFRDFVVESNISETTPLKALNRAIDTFNIDHHSAAIIKKMWDRKGRPSLLEFAPYACFVLSIIGTTLWGVSMKKMTARPTNFIDEQYLYYLPFCQIFVSNDKYHKQMAPLFMSDQQKFIWAEDIKKSLKQLIEYYNDHTDQLKQSGMMGFARYPPLELQTEIHDIYDFFQPDWRRLAMEPRVKLSEEQKARILKEVQSFRTE